MRYPDGGGLSSRERARREAVRLRAADWFAEGVPVAEIARRLRVSATAVYGWRQRWRRGGEQALASTGPGGAVPVGRRPAAALGRRPRRGPGGARLRRRPALDPGEGVGPDRPDVSHPLHP